MSNKKSVARPPGSRKLRTVSQAINNDMTLQIALQVIRGELHFSQKDLADLLGISQPAIAQIEQRGYDIKLITLKRYIEAMGGKLNMTVELPGGCTQIFYL